VARDQPHALVFDVFGTLVDWRTTIAAAFRASGVEADSEELADGWRARYAPILLEVNTGKRAWGNFDELHHITLDDLLTEHGLDLPAEQRERLVQAWHRLDPWPDVREGLDELRRDRVIATLSNGHMALLVDLVRHCDLRFDAVISAELMRVYKPDPKLYLTAARLLGVDAGELMLVAAHPWDLAGARNAGLRTGFVDRPLEYGRASEPRDDADADVSVGDLQQLAERLGPAG
jgi:2-haloacid dehalogenase